MEIHTGDDGLRGGEDNLNIEVKYYDRPADPPNKNVNRGLSWEDRTIKYKTIDLRAAAPYNFQQLLFKTVRGNVSFPERPDEWKLTKLKVTALGKFDLNGEEFGSAL